MDKIILKSNLISKLLGKREITLEDIVILDELLLDGAGVDFSAEEIENIKDDLQYIFEIMKEESRDISFINCPDQVKEYIIKKAPTTEIYFEGHEKFFDGLKANKVRVSKEFQKYIGDDSELTEYETFKYIKFAMELDLEPVINVSDIELFQKYGDLSAFKIKVESLEEYQQLLELIRNEAEAETNIIIDKNLMQQIIDEKIDILPTTNFTLQVEAMTEVTPEQLSYFCENCNVNDVRVSYGPNKMEDIYCIEDFEKMQLQINGILSQVDQSLPKLDRFMRIYEILGKKIQYEFDDDGEPSSRGEAHNMIGGLLENTCVCEGYSKILQQVLRCNGIECKCVCGKGKSEEHAWNQVKIDGQWYNCDLTWDAPRLAENMPLEWCMQSDEEFICHTIDKTICTDVEICDSSYDRNKLQSKLDYAVPIEYEERQYDTEEIIALLQSFEGHGKNGVRVGINMDYSTGEHYLQLGNIVSDNEVKWSENRIVMDSLEKFMQAYIYQYLTTKINREGTVDFIRNASGIELVLDDRLKQYLIEKEIDLESLYTTSRKIENDNQPEYNIEDEILSTQQIKTVDVQRLGKETIDEQKDTAGKDIVERRIEEQMRNITQEQQSIR